MITDSLEEEYLELAKEIDTNSPYKRKESQKRKWMSVLEMGNLLGLKKRIVTGWFIKDFLKQRRYWEKCGSVLIVLKNGMPIK